MGTTSVVTCAHAAAWRAAAARGRSAPTFFWKKIFIWFFYYNRSAPTCRASSVSSTSPPWQTTDGPTTTHCSWTLICWAFSRPGWCSLVRCWEHGRALENSMHRYHHYGREEEEGGWGCSSWLFGRILADWFLGKRSALAAFGGTVCLFCFLFTNKHCLFTVCVHLCQFVDKETRKQTKWAWWTIAQADSSDPKWTRGFNKFFSLWSNINF